MITINTNLGINETIEKLKTSKELARSLQLKIIVGSSDFKLCPSFLGTTVFFPLPSNSSSIKKALSPSILAPRTIIFCAHLKSSSSGTTITGHFRYSWLFRLFWPFFFAIATYFLWVNSGQQYPSRAIGSRYHYGFSCDN